jgi:hypothetical protein
MDGKNHYKSQLSWLAAELPAANWALVAVWHLDIQTPTAIPKWLLLYFKHMLCRFLSQRTVPVYSFRPVTKRREGKNVYLSDT